MIKVLYILARLFESRVAQFLDHESWSVVKLHDENESIVPLQVRAIRVSSLRAPKWLIVPNDCSVLTYTGHCMSLHTRHFQTYHTRLWWKPSTALWKDRPAVAAPTCVPVKGGAIGGGSMKMMIVFDVSCSIQWRNRLFDKWPVDSSTIMQEEWTTS